MHSRALDLTPIVERMVSNALADDYYEGMFASLCAELVKAGVPLLRAYLGMQILHPLLASVDLTWSRKDGLKVSPHGHRATPPESWIDSPLRWMLDNKHRELRQDLRDDNVINHFAVFKDFVRKERPTTSVYPRLLETLPQLSSVARAY